MTELANRDKQCIRREREREREEMLRHRYRDDIKESDVERRKMNQNYKT